jgi:glutamate-1-semialdehyde 2,1-aminomutase
VRDPIHSSQPFSPQLREDNIRKKTAGSFERWRRASASLAGGVSSGLRRSARPYPLFFSHGSGATLHDVDGNTYFDYMLGWGPNILGNAPLEVIEAIRETIQKGLTFGAQHDLEYEVAEMLTKIIPCADRVCFANSGTEIVQVALRLARAATGRRKFIKFEGHYHGWDDSVLQSYHPTAEQISSNSYQPVPVGLGQAVTGSAVIAQWNDVESVQQAFALHPSEISAIICEPLMCNSGCIAPRPGFLKFLREITKQNGALLIFDEVITGFRLGLSGAQGFYGITPDLATYAKAVGAGTPLSVLAGKLEVMELIETGKVVHAGTLNGNLIALSAARAALSFLMRDSEQIYNNLFRRGDILRLELMSILSKRGHQACLAGEGPVFHLSFTDRQPRNYRDLLNNDSRKYSDFLLALLDEGVLPLPDGRWYISAAHRDGDIERTLYAVERAAGK